MKQHILNNLKNIPGWRSSERLVVLAFDDYGNVRQDSRASMQRMTEAGLAMANRYDRYDAVETTQDLEALYDVLASVSDRYGAHAVLTPYALCANVDFESTGIEDMSYHYEALPQTFDRLEDAHGSAYRGAWDLWQEGMRRGLLRPQFHGREHLNVELLERKLRSGDKALMINLENRSLTALGAEPAMPGVGFTHAFALSDRTALDRHREIIDDGLKLFEQVFGFRSKTFTPPAQKLHPDLYAHVESRGIGAIDKPLHCVRWLDKGKSRREFNVLGIRKGSNHVSFVRNVVFEPTNDRAFDSVGRALDQIAAAFRWRRPAIVSSHRVNFTGHIDPENRTYGLGELKRLLDGIVRRWPDVRFISAEGLVERIALSS